MTQIDLNVNGEAVTLEDHQDLTLLAALRDRLGIISPKDGCAPQGQCGCCTVMIDGKPQMACRHSLAKTAGKEVLTLEGLSDRKRRVLAESFVSVGGLQCGFCIPGIAMRAVAMLEKSPEVDRQAIHRAMSPHICRCTGYVKIIEAIETLAEHWHEGDGPGLSEEPVVGGRSPRFEGIESVLGLRPYVDDLQAEQMAYGALRLSEHPRAKVLSIDCSKALAIPGVFCVTTAEDVPGERYQGLIAKDWPVYIAVGETTRTVGDHIASVAAETREIAREAAAAIEVEYEVLEPVTDMRAAIEAGSPEVHPGQSNLYKVCAFDRGDTEAALAASHLVIEETFSTQRIDQAFLEPHSCLAVPTSSGGMEIFTQGQGVHDDQIQVASALGIDLAEVHVELMSNGGGFGGKEDITVQAQAAILANKCRRPVKLTASRDQTAVLHPKRHPIDMHYRIGFDEQGNLTAVWARMIGDTGGYASVGDKVLERAAGHSCGPYRVPSLDIEAKTVYTNNLPCGAMRGFGANQAAFAIEGLLDRAADQLGVDRWQIRKQNVLRSGDRFATGQIMTESLGIEQTLDAVKEAYDSSPYAGIACGIKNTGIGNGMPDIGRVSITVLEGGALEIGTGYTEMGQGHFTILRQIVAQETNLDIEVMGVRCYSGDAIVCGMTTASRATVLAGEAARRASVKLAEDLRSMPISELVGQVYKGEYICDFTVKPGTPIDNPITHMTFGYATQVVLLDDDGKLKKVVAAHDVGKVMNRTTCEGQVEGSVHMGLGYALTEDCATEGGFPVSTKFGDLQVLRSRDTPEIEVKLLEVPDPLGACYGAKGVGEIGLVPTAGAVAGALQRFDGIYRHTLPMRGSAAARAILPKKLGEEDHA